MPLLGSLAAPPKRTPPLLVGTCTVSLKLMGVKRPLLVAASSRFRNASASSGDRYSLISSAVNACLENGGGVVGYGCVGQLSSPGISDFGTGRSSIGQMGSPVTRSNTYSHVVLAPTTTTLRLRPL